MCEGERVLLCMQSNRGTHYHVLAFFNCLGMTCHFDLPARHAGVKHNEAFVCMLVCVCVRGCVSSSN